MTDDAKRSFRVLRNWFLNPGEFKTLEDRFWGVEYFFHFWVGGKGCSNGKEFFYPGEFWQLNSAYAWRRHNWMYREDKNEGWTIPNRWQRFSAYFDVRRT